MSQLFVKLGFAAALIAVFSIYVIAYRRARRRRRRSEVAEPIAGTGPTSPDGILIFHDAETYSKDSSLPDGGGEFGGGGASESYDSDGGDAGDGGGDGGGD
ncbi:MAG: hypothetical protein ABIV06_11880 [Thermoanaerobaculia bacterium]